MKSYYAIITGRFDIVAVRDIDDCKHWTTIASVIEMSRETEITLMCQNLVDLLQDCLFVGILLADRIDSINVEIDAYSPVSRWVDCNGSSHDSAVEACKASLASSGKLFALPL